MVREHTLRVFNVLNFFFLVFSFFFFLWTGIGLILLNAPRALEKKCAALGS